MPTVDAFTLRRLCKYITEHRASHAVLPTMSDLEKAGFSKKVVQQSLKQGVIRSLYSDMTTGAVVKVYGVVD